jgi:[protein-PII] uridylyltransferase
VLTLHGILVLAASAHSDARRWVLDEFKVESEFGSRIDWALVTADIERALFEPATLETRIERKIATYRDRKPRAAHPVTAVRFDNDISSQATVIEVHAPDRIGLLYRLASTFAAAGLDIRSARVQTMGPHAVDAFYVRDHAGTKISDPTTLEKLEQEILAGLHG